MLLPEIRGRFPVGISTFVTPVHPARPIGSVKRRPAHDAPSDHTLPALILEEVAFTAYYPADTSKLTTPKAGSNWFVRPLQESLYGFAAFLGVPAWLLWPVVYLFGALLQIPAYENAPLLLPKVAQSLNPKSTVDQWPLVIFSHGLGGSRTAYSQFCSYLAASGNVVLAVEHRDGTGAVCMPRSRGLDGKFQTRTIYYVKDADISWEGNAKPSDYPMPLRGEQLLFRRHEIYLTYSAISRLLGNDTTLELETLDGTAVNRSLWTDVDKSTGRGPVKFDKDVILTGHSFGGCTVLSMLSTRPDEAYSPIPITQAVVLDPWLEPLSSPGPTPIDLSYLTTDKSEATIESTNNSSESEITAISTQDANNLSAFQMPSPCPRLLVINSETFTIWKDHFARLEEVVKGWEPNGGNILTIVGAKHVAFSDFPVLPIINKKSALPILRTICKLSLAFLEGDLKQSLEEVSKTKLEVEVIGVKKDGKPKRRLIGKLGQVIVH